MKKQLLIKLNVLLTLMAVPLQAITSEELQQVLGSESAMIERFLENYKNRYSPCMDEDFEALMLGLKKNFIKAYQDLFSLTTKINQDHTDPELRAKRLNRANNLCFNWQSPEALQMLTAIMLEDLVWLNDGGFLDDQSPRFEEARLFFHIGIKSGLILANS